MTEKMDSPTRRNLAVLLARAAVEIRPGQAYVVAVMHDPDCPGLGGQSMSLCVCNPIITFEPVPVS